MKSVVRPIIAVILALAAGTSCTTAPAPTAAELPAANEPVFPGNPLRPPIIGRNAGVSAGHPLTTSAAMEILQQASEQYGQALKKFRQAL